MASDNLNQVGKFLKETRDNVDFVLNRKLPFRVTIERIRDVLAPDLPTEMVFKTEHDEQRVTADIRFLKPPSPEAINPDFQGFCESFTVSGTGPHILQVAHEFESGSVHVYMNGAVYDSSKWYEYSSNQIFVSGGPHTLTNTFEICYEVAIVPSVIYIDDFNRTDSAWNVSSGGYTWTPLVGAGGATQTVDGDEGVLDYSSVTSPSNQAYFYQQNGPWANVPIDITITARFVGAPQPSGNWRFGVEIDEFDTFDYSLGAEIDIAVAGTSTYVIYDGVGLTDSGNISFTLSSLSAQFKFRIKIDSTTLSAHIWEATDTEPVGYTTITYTGGSITPTSTATMFVFFNRDGLGSGVLRSGTAYIDSIISNI